MIDWTYNEKEYIEESQARLIPEGDHKVRIDGAEEMYSKAGAPMIKLTLKVSGETSKLFYYLVFNYEETSRTNKNLGDLYASFGIRPGEMNTDRWLGKIGMANVGHREYNGKTYAQVNYFIPKDMQDEAPISPAKGEENIPF